MGSVRTLRVLRVETTAKSRRSRNVYTRHGKCEIVTFLGVEILEHFRVETMSSESSTDFWTCNKRENTETILSAPQRKRHNSKTGSSEYGGKEWKFQVLELRLENLSILRILRILDLEKRQESLRI